MEPYRNRIEALKKVVQSIFIALGGFFEKKSIKKGTEKSGSSLFFTVLGQFFQKRSLKRGPGKSGSRLFFTVLGRFFEIHRFTNSFRPTFVLATLEQTWLGSGLRPDPRWGSTRKNLIFVKNEILEM